MNARHTFPSPAVREIARDETNNAVVRAFLALDPAHTVGWAASSPDHASKLARCIARLTDAMAGYDPDNAALSRMAEAADAYAADKDYQLGEAA